MCEITFLQMSSFSIILSSLNSEFIIFIAILFHFYRYTQISTLVSYITTLNPRIPAPIPGSRIPIPFHAFQPLFSTFACSVL